MATLTWPAGMDARPIGKEDVGAWAELMAAKEKVDAEGENYSAEDLLEELGDPHLDLERDTVGLWAGDQLVGYAKASAPTAVVDVARIRTEGTVHPEWRRRGLGTALMHWLIKRSGELYAARYPDSDGEINNNTISTNTGANVLLQRLGFEECRYSFVMQLALDQPVPEVPLPDGLRMVRFDPQYDEPLRLTHNEVFLDHWGSTPKDPEHWKTWFTGARAFRGDLSYLVLDGDTIATYVLGYEYEADTEATGVREVWVGTVGTRRSHRGRGLARATLAKVLTEAAQAGYQRAGLGVDAENPTGALGLYERLGFTTVSKWATFRLPL